MNIDPKKLRVSLYRATIPGIIGLIAAHYWFVVYDENGYHRFEVWQTPNAREGCVSIGHLHFDLMLPTSHVGGGPTKLVTSWFKEEAQQIRSVLEDLASSYPHCHQYRAWPGPNSNTFIAWVLQQANIKHGLGWNALGKRFPCK